MPSGGRLFLISTRLYGVDESTRSPGNYVVPPGCREHREKRNGM
jgi:hypothetical protein